MSIRVIIHRSWLLVICTISSEGKRLMRMNQEGLLSRTMVFHLFQNHCPQLTNFPKFLSCLLLPKGCRLQPTSPMTTYSPLHFHNILNAKLTTKSETTDQESWLKIRRNSPRLMVWDSLAFTDFASLHIASYGMASCFLFSFTYFA